MKATSLLSACCALVGALATARADDDAPPATATATAPAVDALQVRVGGHADGPAIALAIAAELGVATALAPDGGACAAPCVEVQVDDRDRAADLGAADRAGHGDGAGDLAAAHRAGAGQRAADLGAGDVLGPRALHP